MKKQMYVLVSLLIAGAMILSACSVPFFGGAPAQTAPQPTPVKTLAVIPAAVLPSPVPTNTEAPVPAAVAQPTPQPATPQPEGWVEYGSGSTICPDFNNPTAKTITCSIPAGVSLFYFHSDPLHLKLVRVDGTVAIDQDFPKGTCGVMEVDQGDVVSITTGFNTNSGHYNVNVVAGAPVGMSNKQMAELWMLRIQGVAWNGAPIDATSSDTMALLKSVFPTDEYLTKNDATDVAFFLQSAADNNAVLNVAP